MPRAFHHVLALVAVTLAAIPLGAACGGDDDGGASEVDAGGGGIDAAADDCDQAEQLPGDYRPVAIVSTGDVTPTADGDVTTAVIDATAGGLPNAADNPYIYVDLASGAKVDIDDVDALSSSEWDLAFKRSSIRSNGGDSGPGMVAVAVVAAASLDEVTAAPADGEFAIDDWTDESCQLVALPFQEPNTAFGEWYDYDLGSHVVTPKPEVHVIRSRSGDLFKLQLESYYGDEGDPTLSAVYRVSWAPL